MANWKDRCAFLTPNFITHEVAGKNYDFYPISVDMAFKLRQMASPIAKAFTSLFSGQGNDHSTIDRTIHNQQGTADREVIIEATPIAILEFRASQRSDAIENLIKACTEQSNIELVGEIIMNCMRTEFPPSDVNNPPAKEFVGGTPLPAIGQLVMGVLKANKDVLGPLVAMAQGLLQQALAKAQERVNAINASTTSETTPNSANSTPGSSSKMKSSTSLNEAIPTHQD